MSDTGASVEKGPEEAFDRRVHRRRPVRSLAYVKLDEGNGGIILNASEGGLAVQAVTSLMDDVLPTVSFQLPQSRSWLHLRARTAWTGDSRKVAGLEFLDLTEQTRAQIGEWLSAEAPELGTEPGVLPEEQGVDGAAKGEAPEIPPSPPKQVPTAPPRPDAFVATPRVGLKFESSVARQPLVLPDVETSRPPEQNASPSTLLAVWGAVALILISLAAGWGAGRGAFTVMLQKIESLTSHGASSEPNPTPQSAGPIAQISQIEILDANNQRWQISFNGPMSPLSQNPRWQTSARSSAPATPPQIAFQTWVLSAPVRLNADQPRGDSEKENSQPPGTLPGADSAASVSGDLPAPSSLTAPQPVPPSPLPGADLRPGALIRRVDPVYPALAKDHGITGTVILRITVGPDGIVRGAEFVSGPPVLVDAAKKAVLQWRYAPTVLDGRAIETEKKISLVFQSQQR
jgi:TonB family protein